MSLPQTQITTIEKLHEFLYLAMQLEHATIPPYLTALYSIHPGANSDALHILRVVVVEEMLHLTQAANVLNAVGGKPDLTDPSFVPTYPTYLPSGETDFQVDLQRFSEAALDNFLNIERPGMAPDESCRMVACSHSDHKVLCTCPGDTKLKFYSIGDFYEEIIRGLEYLHGELGDKLFSGCIDRQITPEYFYSGGGNIYPVTDLESAKKALNQIIFQGEGKDNGIYNNEDELSHYYRFMQLKLGHYYQAGDTDPEKPSGPALNINWDAVNPIKKNARLSDYKTPELAAAAVAFNECYANFLATLTSAYNGQPALLLQAVPQMFELRNKIGQLINNPLPGTEGENAAPTFQMPLIKNRETV